MTGHELITFSADCMSGTVRCLFAPARLTNAGSPELLTAVKGRKDNSICGVRERSLSLQAVVG